MNDRCIDCTTCANFAPNTFSRGNGHHYVQTQPCENDEDELDKARAALLACPVNAICIDALHIGDGSSMHLINKLRPTMQEFPRDMKDVLQLQSVEMKGGKIWFVGYHSDKTFGAAPYIVQSAESSSHDRVTVMIDTPKFNKNAINAVKSICGDSGPDYHFITHVDDSAGHKEWNSYFPTMKRIFHSGDLGQYNWGDRSLEQVEILLESKNSEAIHKSKTFPLDAWTLDGDTINLESMKHGSFPEFTILHTPGHSPGSISLLWDERFLFTGDTLAYSTREDRMSGFPRYGHDIKLQAKTLQNLLLYSWEVVVPGHGKCRSYIGSNTNISSSRDQRKQEVNEAIEMLNQF